MWEPEFSELESKFLFFCSKPLEKVNGLPMLVLFYPHRGKKVSQMEKR
jgi:hypothetical protein